MDRRLLNFLEALTGDVYKLLPMRESELEGVDIHLREYMDALIINLDGATSTYPALAKQRQYLWVLNNIQYLRKNETSFSKWRSVILNSTKAIDNLYRYFGGGKE